MIRSVPAFASSARPAVAALLVLLGAFPVPSARADDAPPAPPVRPQVQGRPLAMDDLVEQAGVSTQLWTGFAPAFFEGLDDREKVARGAGMVRYLAERAADTGSRVALYNHGDWFGEPENQVRIIRALPGREIGIVYNFHHGHEHAARFDAVVKAIRPYLWVVNLNGMRLGGPKILPFGAGTEERSMLKAVLDSGFTGPFGVLGHVDEADVEEILRGNLKGLGF